VGEAVQGTEFGRSLRGRRGSTQNVGKPLAPALQSGGFCILHRGWRRSYPLYIDTGEPPQSPPRDTVQAKPQSNAHYRCTLDDGPTKRGGSGSELNEG